MTTTDLTIVVPVFNEEAVIPALLERLRRIADALSPLEIEIFFVDDHSSDRSPDLLREAVREDSRFR